ncbi:MAG: exopolygalacturonase [Rikenellaceae bacterium]|nr:exopolygalacturonase [Rikenellaceae bacterium]
MDRILFNITAAVAALLFSLQLSGQGTFPDGTPIPAWFGETEKTDIAALGTQYRITDHGAVSDSTVVQTETIQAIIDKAHQEGGGVIVIPAGTYLSGSLFFKPGTHLHLKKDAVLKGSDDISNFELKTTRMEGQTLFYFTALVNADGVDGFTLSGEGTLDGNGLRYWKSFWLRRKFNPQCTNMDEMRPRLLYVSNSKDVQISGVRLINSPFWTTHYYKCENLKLIDLYIYSPYEPVRAPSTDAMDIDACNNVLIKNCFMAVCDDAIALKGGKGPTADKNPDNGANTNIIIEDCTFGKCHSVLTCGSEAIHNRNIIVRNCVVDNPERLLHLKMRPDTPQLYEYITFDGITGNVVNFLYAYPWTQFFDLKGQDEIPMSYSRNITMRNIDVECRNVFNIRKSDQFELTDFTFENLDLRVDGKDIRVDKLVIEDFDDYPLDSITDGVSQYE